MALPSISIVIPAVDEEGELPATISIAREAGEAEIIVVDGGSRDATFMLARRLADLALEAPRGRAAQMNAGAALAHGEVLLFLHADTHVPPGFAAAIAAAIAHGALWGRFDVDLRGAHPFIPVVAWLISHRSRWSGIATGDQGLFVRRDVFARLGGFPALPLMEDVALSKRLNRLARGAALRARVSTSARRWERRGLLRTIFLMWALRFAFAIGVSPTRLARTYADAR